MRLKTFLSAYVLFLCILFAIISIVSVYMTRSQMHVLRDKSAREYETISGTLARDIMALYGRAGLPGTTFQEAVETFMLGYITHYSRHGIGLSLTDISFTAAAYSPNEADISVVRRGAEHYIHITGVLPEPFSFFRLDYYFNITENITSMQRIQRVLLFFSIVFSVIAALALYLIVLRIFRPLEVVDATSREIARGNYGGRINVKGKNELASMAASFNQMAEEIESQIRILDDEAKGKQQFIDNFAHEIRTPLTAICGFAEYILNAPFDENEVVDSAEYILDRANHMKQIADSLLKLATLRNYVPTKTDINIPRLFEDVHQTLKRPLHEGGIDFAYNWDVETLSGQEDLIKIVILNLCLNAIKCCPSEGGAIRLTAKGQDGNTVLTVSDNGYGIPNDRLIKVTEAFYRVDRARSQGGAGQGLALCKQIAQVHGAEMTIESAVGTGTQVSISFTSP